MTQKRIMVVGAFTWPWYQEACANALERLGCKVERFGWHNIFSKWQDSRTEPVYRSYWHRLQAGLMTGPTVWTIQKTLLHQATVFKPDIVWFYNVQLISPSTVLRLKTVLPNTTFAQYSNDNPFSKTANPRKWRKFIASIPAFDVHFCYRHENMEDFRRCGAKDVHLLRSYYIPDHDYPVPYTEIPEKFKCDVVFAGHFENDGRIDLLEGICSQGHRLNLFGGGWDAARSKLKTTSPLREKFPVRPVTGDDYRKAICGAKVALCILSTLNRDCYTRRNFQIPAMRTAVLSQYTSELASMFEENKSIVFFRNKEEMLIKISELLTNHTWRQSVADAGFQAVHSHCHDVESRMVDFLEKVHQHKAQLS